MMSPFTARTGPSMRLGSPGGFKVGLIRMWPLAQGEAIATKG